MDLRLRFIVSALIAVLVFTVVKIIISHAALSSFYTAAVDAEFDHDDRISIYFDASTHKVFKERYRKKSDLFSAHTRSTKKVYLNNHVARNLRLDTGGKPGVIRLYTLELTSFFGPGIRFDHRALFEDFVPNDAITVYRLEEDHLLIEADSSDPFITYRAELVQNNLFLEIFVPLIVSALAYLFCKNFSSGTIAAFSDIEAKRSSSGSKINSLDGIRGLAALLVLAQHTGLTKTGGIFGVWLFFCLSGFLLAGPFVKNPALGVSPSYMSGYLFRRITRIVPMYFVVITILFLFTGKIDVALRHYLFLQADGHFWAISQEVFFYLVLPIVMALGYLICRTALWLHIIFLMVLIVAAHRFLTVDVIYLYGNNEHLKPMVGIFLTGTAAAFIYEFLKKNRGSVIGRRPFPPLFSAAGLLILIVSLFMSSSPIAALEHINPFSRPELFGPAAGLFILATLLSKNSFLDRMMSSRVLRAVGIVSYSFYLLHPKIIDVVRGTSDYFASYFPAGVSLFLIAGAATYLISIFTYSFIERAFIGKKSSGGSESKASP